MRACGIKFEYELNKKSPQEEARQPGEYSASIANTTGGEEVRHPGKHFASTLHKN